MNTYITKGFTLIELLIVIGIIAVLATAVLLVLNPAQILGEARDTQRLSDLDTVRGALNLALVNATNPTVVATVGCTLTVAVGVDAPFGACTADANLRKTDGTGWVKTDLTQGGTTTSAVPALPVDPTNAACTPGSGTATKCAYHYKGDATAKTYELDAVLESAKYGGADKKMSGDGGNVIDFYEVGTDPGLDL